MSDKKKHDKKDKRAKKKAGKKSAAKASKKLLKGLHCTGCKKHCPLSNPKCKKGRIRAEEALAGLLK